MSSLLNLINSKDKLEIGIDKVLSSLASIEFLNSTNIYSLVKVDSFNIV